MSTPKISLVYPAEVDFFGLYQKRKKMLIHFESEADREEYVSPMNRAIKVFDEATTKLALMGPNEMMVFLDYLKAQGYLQLQDPVWGRCLVIPREEFTGKMAKLVVLEANY
jgi:hypothetical protein